MSTQQPIWKCIGHVGDVDPIAHGGGFIYTDETGVYGPELQWFEPGTDEDWHKTQGETPLQTYRILLESGMGEWWYERLDHVASSCGLTESDLQADAASNDPKVIAGLYTCLIGYFGAFEFDQYPFTMTEDEAYAKYAEEMKLSLARR